jgi:hypothetical protein
MNLVKVKANYTFLEVYILSGISRTESLGRCLGDDTFGNSKIRGYLRGDDRSLALFGARLSHRFHFKRGPASIVQGGG